jgi:mannose/cellobiose epimerase-like protein (N-acyl-D-glucosamine 2-epimerase family)
MLQNYIDWVVGRALPFWVDAGFDAAAGRFRERLDQRAQPIALPHRSMVQARQIFVFAHAASRGWSAEGGPLSERAMQSLLRDFVDEGGDEASAAFSIDPANGAIVSSVRDAYAHAFLLFAFAAVYRLNGEARLLTLAEKIVRFIERHLVDPEHGGLFDALPAPAEKRQNPHMHLLEAYLFLERAAPGRGYSERAAALVVLFKQRFFRSDPGLLLEYFERDWSVKRPLWEPGHHFEWVWLLDAYEALTGDGTRAWREPLQAIALDRGIISEGLIVDELSATLEVTKRSHRVWPHTEAIKAAATRQDRALADRMGKALLQTFLDKPFAGGWIDHVSPDGAPLVDYVPASSLYHLALAASVAEDAFASHDPAKADA